MFSFNPKEFKQSNLYLYMKIFISPQNSISESQERDLKIIVKLAEKLLKKNNITIPKKIYFYNSFERFIEKVLPEVKDYGFDEDISIEIIKCALNNGTYGTINFKEDSIIEMNFNPFKGGGYSSLDFLELIIHESLHLHLCKKIEKDINLLKFKFNKEKFVGNKKLIQFDEGYAEFMTQKILKEVDVQEIKNIKIIPINNQKPKYKKEINNFDVEKFDKNFEVSVISNREKGLENFKEKFNEEANNEEILNYASKNLENII